MPPRRAATSRAVWGGAALALTLLLASCSAPRGVEPRAAAPKPTPTPTPTPVVVCPVGEPVGGADVVARVSVTDPLGTYCAVSPAPDSPAMQFDEERLLLDALESWDFTPEDAFAAQRTAVTFLVEEVLDSPLLDTQENGTIADWHAATPYRFVDFVPAGGVVLHDRLPPLARDGAPRASDLSVTVTRVTAQGGKTGPRSLLVVLEADASYRPREAAAPVPVHVDYQLTFTPDGGIIGYSYRYDVAD